MRRQMPPTSQIELAHTEVGAFRNLHGLLKRGEELLFNVVKYSWHSFSCSLALQVKFACRLMPGLCALQSRLLGLVAESAKIQKP